VGNRALSPPYARYLARLIRPFANFDLFFIKHLRQKAVQLLALKAGDRVVDAGCGWGASFPYLVNAVGPYGEVLGVEISPDLTFNARKRIEWNRYSNVRVLEEDARIVKLEDEFDGLMMFGAPDVYASPQALANLIGKLKDRGRFVAFGAKLSRRGFARLMNAPLRLLMKLSFSSTPPLCHEPWSVLQRYAEEVHVEEYFFGCMFLAGGSIGANEKS